MTGDDVEVTARQATVGLNPHNDARAIVRLIQCSQCSYPLREPLTLPCGNSLCRRCLPPTFKRENITYPLNAGRSEGFVCPFKDCGLPHAVGDCSLDVTLNKIFETTRLYVDGYRQQAADAPILLDEKLHWPTMLESNIEIMPRSRTLNGGRIVATYVFADMGELDYSSDVAYATADEEGAEIIQALDAAVFANMQEIIKGEVECQVCYSLMLDPLTTSCGHTFCRKCVARVLDHSNLCPVCRRRLPMPPGVQAEPSNKRISGIVSSLLPELLATRRILAQEEDEVTDETTMPLFPCTLAYPHMPTFLHIFEPRYRLMIRRVMENGSQKFAMLAYNSLHEPQGALGRIPFFQYGTVLQIQRVEMFPDGRSLIETTGAYRCRVLQFSTVDGYIVGRLQRVDDVPLAEEEEIEMQETSQPTPESDDLQERINHMSTQQLLQYGLDFISQARARPAAWLHERVLAAYGQPPSDPAIFPYWFASVLPISEHEKYSLLPSTSVRERLKTTARWIHRLEQAQCMHIARFSRTVLDSSSDEEDEEESDEEAEADQAATSFGEEINTPQATSNTEEHSTPNPAESPSDNH